MSMVGSQNKHLYKESQHLENNECSIEHCTVKNRTKNEKREKRKKFWAFFRGFSIFHLVRCRGMLKRLLGRSRSACCPNDFDLSRCRSSTPCRSENGRSRGRLWRNRPTQESDVTNDVGRFLLLRMTFICLLCIISGVRRTENHLKTKNTPDVS